MNTSAFPDNPRRDELTAAAENLLGVDLSGHGPAMEPIELDDDDLPPAPTSDEPATAGISPRAQDAADTPSARDDAAGDIGGEASRDTWPGGKDDFGGGLEFERSAPGAGSAPAEPAKSAGRDDKYWDALEGWDWDDSAEGPARTEPERGAAPAVSGRFADDEDDREERLPTAQQVEEFIEDDEFGAGLIEGDSRGAAPRAAVPGPVEPPPRREERSRAERERDRERGREPDRGRGRRDEERGRGRSGQEQRDRREERHAQPPRPADPVPDDEFGAEVEDESPADVVAEETQGDEGGDFGAGLELEAPRRAPRDQERGRRGGRGRSSYEREREPEPEAPADAPAARDADLADEGERAEQSDADDELAGTDESGPRYRNVPTWEEAISYLVKPTRREGGQPPSRPSSSSGGGGGGAGGGGGGSSGESRGRQGGEGRGDRGGGRGRGRGGRGRGRGRNGGGGRGGPQE